MLTSPNFPSHGGHEVQSHEGHIESFGSSAFHANLFDEGHSHEGHQGQEGTAGQQRPDMYNMLVSDVVIFVLF